MYHRIVPVAMAGDSLEALVVPPKLFAAQLAALRATGWRTMTLAALAADVIAGRRPPARTFVITIDDGHDDGFTDAFPILRRYRDVATYFIVTGRLNHPGNLTDVEVERLASAGMEIGDHTVSHADLPILPIAAAQRQIEIAAETIARLVGDRPTSFAYPYGAADVSVAGLVRRAGFTIAVTTQECAFESGTTAMLTPRIRVGPSTTPLQLVRELEAIGPRPLLPRSS
jgi:peptidoglycan/xylan/chitin deacetylase (PgdA/CDA1 family)